MTETSIANVFTDGQGQAVRLPHAFQLPGDRVRIRWVGNSVLLEPIVPDLEEWFAALDRYRDLPFLEEGREQPPAPPDEALFG